MEASGFRDANRHFELLGASIVGVSPDTPTAQAKFKEKYSLPFTLLCDEEKKVANAYGVLKEKDMYGKKVLGIERTTFVVNADGKIKKIFFNVKPDGHVKEVLEVLL